MYADTVCRVAAALTAIVDSRGLIPSGSVIEFVAAKLDGANFAGAGLGHVTFRFAKLRGARFNGADLSYADFAGADLSDADFTGANVNDATFEAATLTGVKGLGPPTITGSGK